MKTILLSIHNGAVAKNILRTDVIKTLVAEPDVRVVCLMSSPEKADYYKREVPHPQIVYDSFHKVPGGIFERAFHLLKFRMIRTATVDLWLRMSYDRHKNPAKYFFGVLANRFISLRSVRLLLRFLDRHLVGDPGYGAVLEKYRPGVVFVVHLFGDSEVSLLREAKRRGIPTVCFINSWDKMTGQCALRLLPDRMLVFNEIVKREAIEHADMPEERITVCGIPQYDWFLGQEARKVEPREKFLRKMGMDPDKRLVLYSPRGIKFSASDWEVIDFLHESISDGRIPNAQLLVRFPPNDFLDETELTARPWLKYDLPGVRFLPKNAHLIFGAIRSDDWDMGFGEIEHLRNTLAHSSVVIGYTSSIMVDAAVFDKPVVGVLFEIRDNLPLLEQPTQYFHTEHFQKALKSGGIRLAQSREELISAVNAYLADPCIDTEGRQRLREEQCWRLDGKAGERVANEVLTALR